jgi:hypothetical protein
MHPKLERALPLLEHLASGGKLVKSYDDTVLTNKVDSSSAILTQLFDHPERYTIHREPRELFVNCYPTGEAYGYPSKAEAESRAGHGAKLARYVEDLNWKPS